MSENQASANKEAEVSAMASPVAPDLAKRKRIDSVDLLRGIVMVIMMLDHTRDYIHSGALLFDPLDVRQTTWALFLTRWITHFCAPVFVFLAGTGAYLQFARGKSKRELSRFLITRGLWLIVLEVTVVRAVAFFNLDPKFLFFFQVIFVIGVSMIVLAALIHLPLKIVAGFGLIMIAAHNYFDRFRVTPWQGPGTPVPSVGGKLWMLLHQPGLFPMAKFPSPLVFVLYPLIPWIGVMAVGYALGTLYSKDVKVRRRWLLIIGGVATWLFIFIRAIDRYGEPFHWARQKNVLFTILSFINTTKYPPSLDYLLMTLGPAAAVCAAAERWGGRLKHALAAFGRVPFAFYVVHFFVIHALSVLCGWLQGFPVRSFFTVYYFFPKGYGLQLWGVYVVWAAVLLMLWPWVQYMDALKSRSRAWWLSYV